METKIPTSLALNRAGMALCSPLPISDKTAEKTGAKEMAPSAKNHLHKHEHLSPDPKHLSSDPEHLVKS